MNRFNHSLGAGRHWRLGWAVAGAIVLMVGGLYLPFLENPLVFDDRVFFSHTLFAYYATHPLGLVPRAPAYFSLAFTEIVFSRIEAHRVFSLALHVGCALALYRVGNALLRDTGGANGGAGTAEERSAAAAAFVAAAAFALHPAAVYGAAYLVQRSIVLATLFSLLSLLVLARGLRTGRALHLVLAGLLYSMAVLCKEHAILLPVLAVPIARLSMPSMRSATRALAIYFATCAPAALFAVLLVRQLIGQPYEPHVAEIARQIGQAAGEAGAQVEPQLTWAMSAVTQAGLFFRYVAIWLWPDTAFMAVDLRVDPSSTSSLPWAVLKVGAFLLAGVAAGLLVWRRGKAGVAGLGVLYVWVLYFTEFSVPRLQEVFVLYRSYLWAPGIALALAAGLAAIGARLALLALLVAGPVLAVGAHDRLQTFTSSLRLWEDAANKLPAQPVPWGSRILYEVGREYLYSGQPERAKAAADRCMADYPKTWQCVYARGAIHLHLEEFEQALPYLIRAAEMQPKNGIAQHRIGLTLEKLGRGEEAITRYRHAVSLGYRGAAMELDRLGATAAKH